MFLLSWRISERATQVNLIVDPIFWDSFRAEWKKNDLSKKQEKTPLRVVYYEDKGNNGRPKICGVMTHSNVEKNYQGTSFFTKCEN